MDDAVIQRTIRKFADAAAFVPVVNTEETYDTPTFSGVAFLTGINQEEELDRLVATLS